MSFDLSKEHETIAKPRGKPIPVPPRVASLEASFPFHSNITESSLGQDSLQSRPPANPSFGFAKLLKTFGIGSMASLGSSEGEDNQHLRTAADHPRPTLRHPRVGEKPSAFASNHHTSARIAAGSTPARMERPGVSQGASDLFGFTAEKTTSAISIPMSEDMLYQLNRLENPDDSEAVMVKQLQETLRAKRIMKGFLFTQHPGAILCVTILVLITVGVVLFFMISRTLPEDNLYEGSLANETEELLELF